MSFGSNTRFQAGTENGKPVIFWEQQGLARDKKKKFSYKEKSNKHPLRQAKQKSLEESSPTHKPPAGASRPAGASSKQVAAKAIGHKGATASKATDGAAKTGRTAAATKKGAPASDPNAVNPGTVTLTQNQLNTILETIGRLTISNQELSDSQKNVATDVAKKSIHSSESQLTQKSKTQTLSEAESIYSMAAGADIKINPNATPEPSLLPPSPDSAQYASPVPLPPSTVPGGDSTPQPRRGDGQRIRNDLMPLSGRHGGSTVENNKLKPSMDAPKSLTKAELKRLQWEKERAEAAGVYNPWGRPGAGAPIRDTTGNIVADYKVRKNDENDPSPSNYPQKDHLTRQSLENAQLQQSQHMGGFRSESSQPSRTIADRFRDSPSVEPAAIRSSFTLGAVAPDADRFTDLKSQQKKQWLEDLERQREEQRLRKEAERRKLKGEDIHDTWADRMGGYKPQSLPQQERTPKSTVDDTAALQVNKTNDGTRTNSAPTEKTPRPVDPLSESQNSTYIRGQNVLIDPQTQKEMEEKRRRHLEHQEYIKKQVEDKEKQKRAERERKIQEELEEERKLQAERDRIKNIYEMEQEKQRSKEENARRRLEDLKKAMDDAKEQAEREKHQRRLRKLEEGGHQTARYHETYEDTPNNLVQKTHRSPRQPSIAVPSHHRSDSVVQVEPNFVPGLNLGTVRDDLPQSSLALPESYTENRLLTPSQYRGVVPPQADPSSPRREFGTQTDKNVAKQIKKALGQEDSSDTTDIEYRKSRTGKKVRVKSAPKEDKPSHAREKDPKNRPKWGQGGAQKSKLVKNSDKDPSYQRNRRQREARRKERQEKLLAEADKYAKYVPGDATAASRARSKSPPVNRARSRSRSPPVGQSRQTSDSRATQRSRSVRSVAPSPPVPALRKPHDPAPDMESDLGNAPDDGASKERLPQSSRADVHQLSQNRSSSPPVPALKLHKQQLDNDYNVDAYNYDSYKTSDSNTRTQSRVQSAGTVNGQFVPFVRSTNVLDPAHAESPVPVSRENTTVEKARRAYIQNTHPANYGVQLDNLNDKNMQQEQIPVTGRRSSQSKDPIMNPDLVKKVPTERQGQILQQLTELRKHLLAMRNPSRISDS